MARQPPQSSCYPTGGGPDGAPALSSCRLYSSSLRRPASVSHLVVCFVAMSLSFLIDGCAGWTSSRRSPLDISPQITPPTVIGRSSFVPRSAAPSNAYDRRVRRRARAVGGRGAMSMLRNFDLPEAIVFYGTDALLDGDGVTARPGAARLLKECGEVGTAAILLSETLRVGEMEDLVREAAELAPFASDGTLRLRSSLEDATFPPEALEEDPRLPLGRGGTGHAPSPAALLDAFLSVVISPRGFGGSSGFGTKDEGPPSRPPLPKHVVAIVSGPGPLSRARCSASRMAGVRVLYVERDGLGSCDAEDLVDAVVETLGDEDDWDPVTLDGISTPGSYWLNPPNPRDDEGNRVNVEEVVEFFRRERAEEGEAGGGEESSAVGGPDEPEADEMDEDEMQRILADLDSL